MNRNSITSMKTSITKKKSIFLDDNFLRLIRLQKAFIRNRTKSNSVYVEEECNALESEV